MYRFCLMPYEGKFEKVMIRIVRAVLKGLSLPLDSQDTFNRHLCPPLSRHRRCASYVMLLALLVML